MGDIQTTAVELKGLLDELLEEFKAILKGRDRDKLSQSERRLYVRSTFATIEAVIYVMKQIALASHPDPKCQTISEADRAFALEQAYKLTDSGDVEARPTKIALEANIRFAFKLLAKATSVSDVLDVSGAGWQSFQRAVKVRDRITHPKRVSDLTIADSEYADVSAAFKWLLISHLKLGNEIKAASLR